MWRGNCHFVTKTRNAQFAGAHLLIVVDNKDFDELDKVILSDDGTGSGLTIPTAMIDKAEGEAILGYMDDFPEQKIQIVYTFETNRPDDHVEVEVWMSSADE